MSETNRGLIINIAVHKTVVHNHKHKLSFFKNKIKLDIVHLTNKTYKYPDHVLSSFIRKNTSKVMESGGCCHHPPLWGSFPHPWGCGYGSAH
jgi:hypothetical protein